MIPLLFPFVWQGIYIPVLPYNLHEYLDAPVPFIMGTLPSIIILVPPLTYGIYRITSSEKKAFRGNYS